MMPYTTSDKVRNMIKQLASAGGGTTVIANPEGTATATLNKIKIADTIYSVEGGGSGSGIDTYYGTFTFDEEEVPIVTISDADSLKVLEHIKDSKEFVISLALDSEGLDYIFHCNQFGVFLENSKNADEDPENEYVAVLSCISDGIEPIPLYFEYRENALDPTQFEMGWYLEFIYDEDKIITSICGAFSEDATYGGLIVSYISNQNDLYPIIQEAGNTGDTIPTCYLKLTGTLAGKSLTFYLALTEISNTDDGKKKLTFSAEYDSKIYEVTLIGIVDTQHEEFIIDTSSMTEKAIGAAVPTIALASSQLVKAGQDPSYGSNYITFSTTAAQQAILTDENNAVIKMDVSAVQEQLSLPVPYIWVKRNVKQTLAGVTVHQFDFADSGFNYAHYATDDYISIMEIGDGGMLFGEDEAKHLYVSMQSINPTVMWSRIGALETNVASLTSQVASKQAKLIAGSNIEIKNNTISATSTIGTQLYRHVIKVTDGSDTKEFRVINKTSTKYTSMSVIAADWAGCTIITADYSYVSGTMVKRCPICNISTSTDSKYNINYIDVNQFASFETAATSLTDTVYEL